MTKKTQSPPKVPAEPRSLPQIVRSDADLLERKQQDYSTGNDPWLNFREAAEFVNKTRGTNISHLDAAYLLLGLKISRLKNLGRRDPRNESKHDTLQDLRGYAAIIQAIEEEEGLGAVRQCQEEVEWSKP